MKLYRGQNSGFFNKYESQIDAILHNYGGLFGIVLFLFFYVLAVVEPFGHVIATALIGYDFWGLILSLLSIFALIYICKILPPVYAIKYISRHSIGFFFLSAPIPFIWCKVIDFSSNIVLFFIGVIGSFVSAWFIVFILNRYAPFLFDIRKLKSK